MDAKHKRGLVGSPSASVSPQSDNYATNRGYAARSYGFSRRGIRGNFVPPIRSNGGNASNITSRVAGKGDDALDDSIKRWLVFVSSFFLWSFFLRKCGLNSSFISTAPHAVHVERRPPTFHPTPDV